MTALVRAFEQRRPTEPADRPEPNADAAPIDSVSFVLYRTTLVARRLIDARMAVHGLTDAQWRPLSMLSRGSADTTAGLAREMCIDAGALTRMLDRLEAKGLVERSRSQVDRRVVNVRLTPEGEQVAANIPQAIADVDRQLLKNFTHGDESMLRLLCTRMQANSKP